MLPRKAVVTGLLTVLSITGQAGQELPREQLAKGIEPFKKELPKLREMLAAVEAEPEPSAGTAPLPEPSLTEPFEIGEALYDQARMADAVVSLLALMKIGIVPDANANARAQGLTLSGSEVNALIDLAREDLEASDNDMERLPYKFSDLHSGIADLLPGVTVEALAETYTKAYEAHADDLIAKAMMGRPIEPGTTLTRAQIWFLLMDGFAGAAAKDAEWGTADREVADLKSPNAQWSAEEFREVLARLPLVTANQVVSIEAPDVVSPGATAGPPVNVTARVAASVPPLVSRATGRTLLASRGGSLAGQEVTWRIHAESLLPELGKIITPVDEPARVGANGLARFVIQPGIDPTRGAGSIVNESEPIEARFDTGDLVASAYPVPAPLAGLSIGTTRARGQVRMRFRSPEKLYLVIYNSYTNLNFEIPLLGGGTRGGMDKLYTVLYKRPGGSVWGKGGVEVNSTQTLRGGVGNRCPSASVNMSQKVRVKLDSQSGFGPTHTLANFVWVDSQFNPTSTMATTRPDGGYYSVIISPRTEPPFGRQCISIIPAGRDRQGWGAQWFIPLNDAQWTTSGQGYGIALRAKGLTLYLDTSSIDPLAGTPLAKVKALLQLNSDSLWLVAAAPTLEEILAIGK